MPHPDERPLSRLRQKVSVLDAVPARISVAPACPPVRAPRLEPLAPLPALNRAAPAGPVPMRNQSREAFGILGRTGPARTGSLSPSFRGLAGATS